MGAANDASSSLRKNWFSARTENIFNLCCPDFILHCTVMQRLLLPAEPLAEGQLPSPANLWAGCRGLPDSTTMSISPQMEEGKQATTQVSALQIGKCSCQDTQQALW